MDSDDESLFLAASAHALCKDPAPAQYNAAAVEVTCGIGDRNQATSMTQGAASASSAAVSPPLPPESGSYRSRGDSVGNLTAGHPGLQSPNSMCSPPAAARSVPTSVAADISPAHSSDDDAFLATLASKNNEGPTSQPTVVVTPSAKIAPKRADKRTVSNESSSVSSSSELTPSSELTSSDSSDADSNDEDQLLSRKNKEPQKRTLPKAKPPVKPRSVKRPPVSDADDDSDDSESSVRQKVVSSKRERVEKDSLIADVLCRWWFVLPPWPPEDYDYEAALLERKCRVVYFELWEEADDVDENGFTKVYPVGFYPGMFRDPMGRIIDVRPMEGRPCYSNLKSRSELELFELLVTALRNQIDELRHSPYRNTEEKYIQGLESDLKKQLERAETARFKLKQRHELLNRRQR